VVRAAAWVAVVTALLTLVIAHAGADAGAPTSLEVDVADGVGAGEPELAVDTVHHSVLISYTASEVCKIAVSGDDGATWQIASHPADPGPTPGIPYHNCSDSAAATGGAGRMYVGAGWWDQPAGAVDDYNMYVSGSGDGGRTWSPSAFATGDNAAAQNLALARNSGHTDRLFLTADASTGTVYGTAVDFPRTQRWIVASHDGGRSFGPPHAIDSVQYPEAGVPNDYIPSAANGVVGVAYDADGSGCPCNIFETSRDDGATWTRRFSPIQAEWTAADPAHPGHFAVMAGFGITARTSTPDSVVVSSTSDYGKTWTKPVSIGQDPQNMRYQPWIGFSPTGVLGVGYKTVYGNVAGGTYDYWAAISYDGGRTFGGPIRMSHAISPSEGPGNNGGDDFTGIALDDNYLYAAWADERSKSGGGLSLYFARVPLGSSPAATPSGPSPTPAPRPAAKRSPVCHSHRTVHFTLPRHATRARVKIDGRRRTLRRHGRTLILHLNGLPRRPVTVLIRARVGSRVYIHARTLHPCVKGPTSPLPPGDAG
jgi:hypothetical protein